MDGARFDRLTQQVGQAFPRRHFGVVLAALGLGRLGTLDSVKLKAKKKKKKKCKNGTVRCGKACVDTRSDSANCGGCGNRCGNGQVCAGGQCQGSGGCAGNQTACGGQCVDTQTDNRHCGGCGTACGAGTSCAGGQCVQPPECASDYDCGAGGDLTCNLQTGRCVCKTPGEGICYRYTNAYGLRAGECNPCCGDGDGVCLRDYGCHGIGNFGGTPYSYCHCPPGTVSCPYGESFRCSEDLASDHRRCGQDCRNCLDEFGYCRSGACDRGCNLGSSCAPNLTRPCGANGFPCNSDSICCNMGPGTFPRCIPNVNGVCYLNGV